MSLAECGDEGAEQVHLADADGMEPRDRLLVRIGHTNATEQLRAKFTAIPPGDDASPHQPRRQHGEREQINEIEQEHGNPFPDRGSPRRLTRWRFPCPPVCGCVRDERLTAPDAMAELRNRDSVLLAPASRASEHLPHPLASPDHLPSEPAEYDDHAA